MATTDSTTKVCIKCGEEKPATTEHFHKAGQGLRARCKRCVSKSRVTGNKITKFEKDDLLNQGLRRCSKCKVVYLLSEDHFPKSSGFKDGLNPHCKHCHSVYREANRDRINAGQKEYRTINAELHRSRSRKYYHAHRDQKIEYNHKYYNDNRPRLLLQKKDYAFRNPERVRANWRNMDAIQREAEGTHTEQDIIRIFSNQRGKCVWCGSTLDNTYHVDHVIPLVRGGDNYPHNLAVSCQRCNQSKSKKLPWIWRKSLYWITTLSFVEPAILTNHTLIYTSLFY